MALQKEEDFDVKKAPIYKFSFETLCLNMHQNDSMAVVRPLTSLPCAGESLQVVHRFLYGVSQCLSMFEPVIDKLFQGVLIRYVQ